MSRKRLIDIMAKVPDTAKPEFDPPPQKAERKKKEKTPHKCPICEGKGVVPCGFYGTSSSSRLTTEELIDECRTCKGKGIVWG
jgi:hypothetical protein